MDNSFDIVNILLIYKLACECKLPVHFYGRSGGMIPVPSDIAEKAKEIMGEVALGGAK